MATDKRQFTLRIQNDTYEKIRCLARIEHRSIAIMRKNMGRFNFQRYLQRNPHHHNEPYDFS